MNDRQTQWVQWIHLAEWWYNSTYHTSTKMSPFESLYGYPPPIAREYIINNFKVPTARDYLATFDEAIRILKNHLKQARNHMKQQEDSKRTDRKFEVGDWVFVHLQPYKQNSLKKSKNHKLAPKFYGPFQVRKRVGQVSYALEIPNKGIIHDVFHVSCLKNKLAQPLTYKLNCLC